MSSCQMLWKFLSASSWLLPAHAHMLPAHLVPHLPVLYYVFSGRIVPRRIPPILFLVLSCWKDMLFSIPASSISTTFIISSIYLLIRVWGSVEEAVWGHL